LSTISAGKRKTRVLACMSSCSFRITCIKCKKNNTFDENTQLFCILQKGFAGPESTGEMRLERQGCLILVSTVENRSNNGKGFLFEKY